MDSYSAGFLQGLALGLIAVAIFWAMLIIIGPKPYLEAQIEICEPCPASIQMQCVKDNWSREYVVGKCGKSGEK